MRERERERKILCKQTISKIFFLLGILLQLCYDRCHIEFLAFCLVFVITSLAIVSSLMSLLIRCSCLVFVIASLAIGSSFNVILNSLLLFSVCDCKSCNWVKFNVILNSLLLFSVCDCKSCNWGKF